MCDWRLQWSGPRSLTSAWPPLQVEAWRQAAGQAQQAIELLITASTLLASIIQRHKLGGQRVGGWEGGWHASPPAEEEQR